MSDIEAIATKVIELIPVIVEKKPDLAFKLFETLKRYFVPLELFQEYLKKLDKIEKKVDKIEADVSGLKQDVSELKQDVSGLKQDVSGLKQDVSGLKRKISKLEREFVGLKREVRDIKISLDRVLLSLEEESRSVVRWWLRQHSVVMDIDNVVMCGMEIDLFGTVGDYVLIGDATVRAGSSVVRWIYNRAKKLVRCKPEYRKKKLIIVVYAMYFSPDAIDLAESLGVWLVSDRKEVTNFRTLLGEELEK